MESSVPYLPESVRKKYWGTGWRIYLIEGYLRLFEFQDITGALEVYSWLEGMSDLPLSLTRIATAIKTARGRIRIGLNSVQAMLASVRPDLDKRKLYDFQKRLMTSDLLLNLNQDWRSFLKSRNPKKSTALWGEFKRLNQVPSEDPLGGEIYLNSEGKIWTKSDWKPLVQEDKEF